MNLIRLLIFPVCEIVFLLFSFYFSDKSLLLSLLFGFMAAMALSFSLHITYHYYVHFKIKNNWLNGIANFVFSLLMGIPFHYYQMSHWNHHKYNNTIGDFTSTWQKGEGTPKASNFFFYSFCWFFAGNYTVKNQISQARKEGYMNDRNIKLFKIEAIAIICLIILLFSVNLFFGLIYIMMVYTGWCMIAMHNYGQHLPENYGSLKGNSFYNKFYNTLFINNGWHREHHEKPELRYWEIQPNEKEKITHPHLLEGFFFFFRKKGHMK